MSGAESFESHRAALAGLAYRMLGSRAEAEDVVQDTWLRWRQADRGAIGDERGYLLRIAGNLCLDRLKSARARREVYVGNWLPEPLVETDRGWQSTPEHASEFADDVSVAFMLALERLTPAERGAFILHDVFGCEFSEVAEMLGRSPAACRQLATRARRHVRSARPRAACSAAEAHALARSFTAAVASGDLETLAAQLSDGVRFVSDGGGRVAAVPKPVSGRERVARLLLGFARTWRGREDLGVTHTTVNGLPGFVLTEAGDRVVQTVALEHAEDGRVSAIYVVRNPDKLGAVRVRDDGARATRH